MWSEPGSPMDRLRAQLLGRRTILVRGDIDDEAVMRLASELLVLDDGGDRPIEVHLDSGGGPLGAALAAIDALDTTTCEVRGICVGRAEASAVGVFAACRHRAVSPHARLRLCEPSRDGAGDAARLQAFAEQAAAELAMFVGRVARACGRPAEHVEAEIAAGRWFDARAAVAYGLAHEVRG